MSFLKTVRLSDFRNYKTADLQNLEKGFVVLYGSNGAGKTNVLEAVSLFSPGRGLRSTKLSEIQRQNSHSPWTVFGQCESLYGDIPVGTAYDPTRDKRQINIKGVPAKAQTALSDYLNILWITPQMDGLFLGGASERRRFLDRLVFAKDAAHSGRVRRYENLVYERSKLLKNDDIPNDPVWLDSLEAQIAETGIAIAASRLDYIERLTHAIAENTLDITPTFPTAALTMTGFIEDNLGKIPALEIEKKFKNHLKGARDIDAIQGGASLGPHRSDLKVTFVPKDMDAANCSTGEQKALLLGIVLAHCWLIKQENNTAPICLLDEVAAHLDPQRRKSLYAVLESMEAQVWLTGTDRNLFDDTPKSTRFFKIEQGQILSE